MTLHASSVILIAFATALVTSIATTLITQRVSSGAGVAAASETIVPDLSGLTEAEARTHATTSRFTVLIAGREAAPGKKPGTVLRQSVPPGQRVPEQHAVSLVLADELPAVPNLGGLSVQEATARLEQAGFKATVSAQVPDANVPEGKVLAQAPAADTPLEKGAAVSLRVSSGPPGIEVPSVVGIVVNQAKRKLEEQGFKPVVEWAEMSETGGLIVLRQTPEAGEKAKPGSEVTIVANR